MIGKLKTYTVIYVIIICTLSCSTDMEKGNYSNGKLKYEVPLKDGKRHGVLRKYYESGTIQLKSRWNNGVKEGKLISYYKNGQAGLIEPYNNGKIDGIVKNYDSLGNLVEMVTYKLGKKKGPYQSFYKNGKLEAEGNYKDDVEHGKFLVYYPNGEIMKNMYFDKGELVYLTEFNEEGSLKKSFLAVEINQTEPYSNSSIDSDIEFEIKIPYSFYEDGRIGVVLDALDTTKQ